MSNEYLIGGAAVRYADQYGAFYGARELIWLIGRFLPRSVWPDVYVQLPQLLGVEVDLRKNGGVSREGIASVANFEPSVGLQRHLRGACGWSLVPPHSLSPFDRSILRKSMESREVQHFCAVDLFVHGRTFCLLGYAVNRPMALPTDPIWATGGSCCSHIRSARWAP